MGFFNRQEEVTVSRQASLAAVPVVNDGVTSAPLGADGNLLLTVRVRRGRGYLARFQPPVLEKRIKLDELGTFVYNQIDGKKSTLDIIEAFLTRYRTSRREAELSTVAFLKSLTERLAISIVVEKS